MMVRCDFCDAVFDDSELLRDYDIKHNRRTPGAEYCPNCLATGFIVEHITNKKKKRKE